MGVRTWRQRIGRCDQKTHEHGQPVGWQEFCGAGGVQAWERGMQVQQRTAQAQAAAMAAAVHICNKGFLSCLTFTPSPTDTRTAGRHTWRGSSSSATCPARPPLHFGVASPSRRPPRGTRTAAQRSSRGSGPACRASHPAPAYDRQDGRVAQQQREHLPDHLPQPHNTLASSGMHTAHGSSSAAAQPLAWYSTLSAL